MVDQPDTQPLAYFLTWTTYGTWLHGDRRGSVDRGTAGFDSAVLPPNELRHATMVRHLVSPPVLLGTALRRTVQLAIEETCAAKHWKLEAVNVRTNHVHIVVSASANPEKVLTALKAWATRKCREADLVASSSKLWTRHGSTRYLWSEREIETAREYVISGQGADLPGRPLPGERE